MVLTNIQSPYNAEFYAELQNRRSLLVYYGWDPAALGRAWHLPRRAWEAVGASWMSEAAAVWRHRAGAVILSGDYVSPRSVMRLAATRVTRQRYFWGERLSPHGRVNLVLRRILLSGLDAVFAVGSWAREGYRRVVGSGTPIHVLPYVCEGPGCPRRPAADPVIGFVGGLSHRKGLDILLKALDSMKDPPRLEIVGSGGEEQALRRLATDLGVNASWLGELSVAETNRIRASWWVQAVPSRYDGWAVVVNEGIASGVPVLASSMTGAAHDLLDGRCGDIVWSEDAWGSAIAAWLTKAIDPFVTASARRIAESISARSAAAWLTEVLADPCREERDFIAESIHTERSGTAESGLRSG